MSTLWIVLAALVWAAAGAFTVAAIARDWWDKYGDLDGCVPLWPYFLGGLLALPTGLAAASDMRKRRTSGSLNWIERKALGKVRQP